VEQVFELRRRPVPDAGRALREYRLYGVDGVCLLAARIRGTRMLPRAVDLSRGAEVVARIRRRGLLGRRLVLEEADGNEQLRLDLPVMTSAARTRPFDLVDPQGQVHWRFAPPSGLKQRRSPGSAWLDSELVLMSGDEVIGATRPSHGGGHWSEGPTGFLRLVTRVPQRLSQLAAQALPRDPNDAEVAVGSYVQGPGESRVTPPLVMLLLLFRRFDYDFMRDLG
jgi:hypothetical protein